MKSGGLCIFAATLLGAASLEAQEASAGAFQEQVRRYEAAKENSSAEGLFRLGTAAAMKAWDLEQMAECSRISEEALEVWRAARVEGDDWVDQKQVRLTVLDLYGRLERALENGGRIGLGWQRLREMTTVWRDFSGLKAEPGAAVLPTEVPDLVPTLRNMGWRMIDREAIYLHNSGRSVEALELLDAALVLADPDLAPREGNGPLFYASKLLSTKASVLDFIGYEDRAIPVFDRVIPILEQMPADSRLASARINRLLAISDWEGAREDLVAQAREVVAREKARSGVTDSGMQRVLANLELALKQSRDQIENLREAARRQQENGLEIDGFLSERDALFAEADFGTSGLDEKFNGLLRQAFSQGNRRAEPRIFRNYGHYLLEQKRPGEAVVAYREGLSRVQQFRWIAWEPMLRANLAIALWQSGDREGAKRALAELEAWYTLHPDVAATRRVSAERLRINLLLAMGDLEKARAVLEKARLLADKAGLTDAWKIYLAADVVEPLFLAAAKPPAVGVVVKGGSVVLAPSAIRTKAVTGEEVATRFHFIQQGAENQRGKVIAKGPGAALVTRADRGVSFRFTSGRSERTVEIPAEVAVGMALPVDIAISAGTASQNLSLSWLPESGGPALTGVWEISWGEAWSEAWVLEAARVTASPFHPVPVLHTVRLSAAEDRARSVAFRIVSPVELRIEYRDSASGKLLAVDSNGNGDFSEKGDLYPADAVAKGLPAAAILPVEAKAATAPVEVWIFGSETKPVLPAGGVQLSVEINEGRGWTGAAADVVEPVK